MEFSVIREHRHFFSQHRMLECSDILSLQQVHALAGEIKNVLTRRRQAQGKHSSPDILFEVGRDLWRDSALLKKIATDRGLAQIASELTLVSPLRIAYDQFFPFSKESSGHYHAFLTQQHSLQELSGVQGSVCGLMLCVTPPSSIREESSVNIFTHHCVNGVFFASDLPIDFSSFCCEGGEYWMIIYATSKAVYCRQDRDPNNHCFKKLGYNYGDLLLDSLNPVIYR